MWPRASADAGSGLVPSPWAMSSDGDQHGLSNLMRWPVARNRLMLLTIARRGLPHPSNCGVGVAAIGVQHAFRDGAAQLAVGSPTTDGLLPSA
jgi:hypothetical protein